MLRNKFGQEEKWIKLPLDSKVRSVAEIQAGLFGKGLEAVERTSFRNEERGYEQWCRILEEVEREMVRAR